MAHMTRILNDLLDVSRITMKKVELSKEWIDLGEIIRRTVEATTAHMQERKHTLTLNLYEKPIFLFLDPIRMEQVFANLFHNAAKYTDIGGKIEVTISKEGNEALVRIKDNGVGIETASLLKIFEFFVQSKKSKKCPKNGLGIGLGIAKYFTELHGGTITAYSEGPEKGSEFVVRLPIPPPGAHSMEKTLSEEKFQPLSHANV
jgi:two-component system CheB/CheR fusion protein